MEEQKKKIEAIRKKLEDQEMLRMAEQGMAENCFDQLEHSLSDLRIAKPEERNERARRFAVTITELEKVIAYFKMYVVDMD